LPYVRKNKKHQEIQQHWVVQSASETPWPVTPREHRSADRRLHAPATLFAL